MKRARPLLRLEEIPFQVRKDDRLKDTLQRLCSEIEYLEQLSLAGCFILKKLLKNTPRHLVKIDLSNAYGFNGGGIAFLPKTITHVKLDNTDITDYSVGCLPKSVLYLSVRQCPNITSVTIKWLPPNLKVLLIEDNKKITNLGARHMPSSLETLSLVKCKQITELLLPYLPPNLIQLCVSESNKICANRLSSWSVERGVEILASIPTFSLDMESLSNFEEMNNRDSLYWDNTSKRCKDESIAPKYFSKCSFEEVFVTEHSIFDSFSPLPTPFEEELDWIAAPNLL